MAAPSIRLKGGPEVWLPTRLNGNIKYNAFIVKLDEESLKAAISSSPWDSLAI